VRSYCCPLDTDEPTVEGTCCPVAQVITDLRAPPTGDGAKHCCPSDATGRTWAQSWNPATRTLSAADCCPTNVLNDQVRVVLLCRTSSVAGAVGLMRVARCATPPA
jgi:hypothetical protein